MRLLRSILRYLALILVVGGVVVCSFEYVKNKTLFEILFSDSTVKGSMHIFKTMALAVLAVFVGLLIFILSMKLSSSIRRAERERNAELKQKEKENKENNIRLQKEADEAKKQAEEAKKEVERIKETMQVSENNNNNNGV